MFKSKIEASWFARDTICFNRSVHVQRWTYHFRYLKCLQEGLSTDNCQTMRNNTFLWLGSIGCLEPRSRSQLSSIKIVLCRSIFIFFWFVLLEALGAAFRNEHATFGCEKKRRYLFCDAGNVLTKSWTPTSPWNWTRRHYGRKKSNCKNTAEQPAR